MFLILFPQWKDQASQNTMRYIYSLAPSPCNFIWVIKPFIYTVLCNITIYITVYTNFMTALDHLSDDSLLRCKTHGVLWEDNENLEKNLVPGTRETHYNFWIGICVFNGFGMTDIIDLQCSRIPGVWKYHLSQVSCIEGWGN